MLCLLLFVRNRCKLSWVTGRFANVSVSKTCLILPDGEGQVGEGG